MEALRDLLLLLFLLGLDGLLGFDLGLGILLVERVVFLREYVKFVSLWLFQLLLISSNFNFISNSLLLLPPVQHIEELLRHFIHPRL